MFYNHHYTPDTVSWRMLPFAETPDFYTDFPPTIAVLAAKLAAAVFMLCRRNRISYGR
jgi:hypothetical protein